MSVTVTHPPGSVLPTHLDLPHTDDKPVENAYQPIQSMILTGSLTPHLDHLNPDGNYFIGADTGVYWRTTRPPEDGCKAPDWFYVAGVPRLLDGELRRSYVMWQEVVSPLLVIEYVSGTGAEERDDTPYSGKFWVYERAIKAGYYAIWDPRRVQLDVFELAQTRYQPVPANARGRYRIPAMQLELGVWEGDYQGNPGPWLRAWGRNRMLLPTPEETGERERQRADQERTRAEAEKQRAEQEKSRAEAERQRAEQEKSRADALAAKLRELGVDPDRL